MLLSLWIVIIHCCRIRTKFLKILLLHKLFHVPTFLIISFYFFYDKLYLRNINKIKIRFERLLIPYIIYPIIVIIINLFTSIKTKIISQIRALFFVFIKQLIFGMGIHPVFWFQFYMIFLSIFFNYCTNFQKKLITFFKIDINYLLFIAVFRLIF